MTLLNKTSIHALNSNEAIPYDLLLLADPSRSLIDAYSSNSVIYVAVIEGAITGVYVLHHINRETAEIKNIAIAKEHQGQGLGTLLLNNAVIQAKEKGYNILIIGTGNSSFGQLYLYQKLGFEIQEIRMNFFTDNYAEPIYENGIQCKHMIMLSQTLK